MLSRLDSLVILASLALVVFAALRAARKKAGGAEYFLAGRDLAWPFVGMSLFITNISAEHVIGLAGDAYRIGIVAGGFEWMAVFDLILLALFFAPLYLRAKVFTIPEFLEGRFGWSMRAFHSANLLFINVFTKVAPALWAASLLFNTLLGWDQTMVMLGMSAFTAVYTMKGGLRAVVYADMIQGSWLIVGSAILVSIGLSRVGGWEGLVAQAPTGMLGMAKPLDHELPITGFFLGNLVAGMFYWCMDQTNVQRVLGARSVEDGQKGAILAGFLKLLPVFLLVLPGVIARVLYPDLDPYDRAYAHLVHGLLPAGLRGLVVAGLIAALMSSISACYNSTATLVTRDFVMRRRPNLTERSQVIVGRWATVVMAVLGVLAAPLVGLSVTLWHYQQLISAYLLIPMSAAIFVGLAWKGSNLKGAVSAVSLGFGSGIIFFLDQTLGWSLPVLSHPYLNSFLHRSFVVWVFSAVVMVGVSTATRPAATEKVQGYVFAWPSEPWKGTSDLRAWTGLLVVAVLSLWWIFR